MQYDALFKDVASVLVQKCVNPETNRPYTGTMLERALRDAHFAVDPKRSAKQQALEVRCVCSTGWLYLGAAPDGEASGAAGWLLPVLGAHVSASVGC